LYRLSVIHLHVPRLRERLEDVQPLAQHSLARVGRKVTFTDDALAPFNRYRWPATSGSC
jgi:DNA-binding NtrC family response regulator